MTPSTHITSADKAQLRTECGLGTALLVLRRGGLGELERDLVLVKIARKGMKEEIRKIVEADMPRLRRRHGSRTPSVSEVLSRAFAAACAGKEARPHRGLQ